MTFMKPAVNSKSRFKLSVSGGYQLLTYGIGIDNVGNIVLIIWEIPQQYRTEIL